MFFLNIATGKGVSFGSQGHWNCGSALPLNCCKGIGGENAINITLSLCRQKSGYPLSTVFRDLKYFVPCNFNES